LSDNEEINKLIW